MVTHIARHDFATVNVSETMAPVLASAEEALAGLATSEFDRYDALALTLAAAKWHCLQDPVADRFTTWKAWILAMQTGSALFAAGRVTEGTVTCRIDVNGEGLVALGPLAIACMARDAGMPIEVESEYLPQELLEFGWVGEVDA
ncbi:Imm49 family immunity protein [Streptomyces erythrochromogenes]|uniref:Imm49 family immunity protein n=1 Tax=Streptomyces erythrochromogenes TaxID=285574 RepID=UPI0033D089F4